MCCFLCCTFIFSEENPCSTENGGCDHYCHFENRSLRCSCAAGFVLQSDQKSCKGLFFFPLRIFLYGSKSICYLFLDFKRLPSCDWYEGWPPSYSFAFFVIAEINAIPKSMKNIYYEHQFVDTCHQRHVNSCGSSCRIHSNGLIDRLFRYCGNSFPEGIIISYFTLVGGSNERLSWL